MSDKSIHDYYYDGQYHSLSGVNYTHVLFFERKYFDPAYVDSKRKWMSENWYMSIVYAFLYVILIFGGQKFMQTREKFDLRKPLIAWNFILAAFSAIGTIRVWPEFIHSLTNIGVEHSVCNKSFTHGVTGCWAWLFILSKLPELFDTVFIVLRKQPLIFLHWYHHATVLIYCWFSCKDFSSSGRWFVVMNYTVHAFMYTYYAFRALRFNIPKFVNIAITTGQISQMIFGIYVNLKAYGIRKRGDPCDTSDENITVSFMMYGTYFLLFFHFFYLAYIKKPTRKITDNNAKKQQNGVNGVHHKNNNNSIIENKKQN
jgi:elongation of very long chain fatty acids protein 6